jgi:hypothetical protein
VRKGKGGIDFFRYYKEIMIAKFIPFAKECKLKWPSTLVQKDGAPADGHHFQAIFHALHNIAQLL